MGVLIATCIHMFSYAYVYKCDDRSNILFKHNALCFFSTSEPIIKPVRHKQFTLMEQELPATVYDME